MENSVKTIQSVQRAINIINCFDEENVELSLNTVSERLTLNINTTRGIMNTLVVNGLIVANRNSTYSLGHVYLQKAVLINKSLVGAAKDLSIPFLEHIAETYHVSCRLQIASSHNIGTIYTLNPRDSHYLLVSQAKPLPLHAAASGKIFLAYNKRSLSRVNFVKFTEKTLQSMDALRVQLDDILCHGYSLEREEIGVGICSVAVPIVTEENTLFGTISITTLSPIFSEIWESAVKEMKDYTPVFANALFAGGDDPTPLGIPTQS